MSVPRIIKVSVYRDIDCPNPMEMDCQWTIYTFQEKHNSLITDVERSRFYDDDGAIHEDVASKLKVGLAFGVYYREHGLTDYQLVDHADIAHVDGLLIWEHDADEMGARTAEDRRKDAESFLEEYTRWANGDCYGYRIEVLKSATPEYDPDKSLDNGAYWEDTDDGCWGLIGSEYAAEEIKSALKSYEGYRVVYRGDSAHII